MNNKKQSKILLKVIKTPYQQRPDIQESIDFEMANVCREENVS